MELLEQAVTIMVLGMSLVFVFLAVVILCVQGTAKAVRDYEARQAAGSADVPVPGAEAALAAAIGVAIREQPSRGTAKG